MRKYIQSLGPIGIIGLATTMIIIIVAEVLFFSGNETKALFVGLWAPTLLGVLNYIKLTK